MAVGQTDMEKTSKLNTQAQVVMYLLKQISDTEQVSVSPIEIGKASGNCPDSKPSFSSLASAGSITQCGSCHNNSLYRGDLDISDYKSVINFSEIGDPENSILYLVVIPNGRMHKATTQILNDAIYCWIKGGATQ